jgi:AcrR family transcriptional regulator
MGRPPRHDTDRLLDVAVSLAAATGPSSVTMAAVARAAGAPSGSVYHRFPTRAALLAALWLRTVDRFQEGFLAALADEQAQGAARHVITWSRANPDETRVLLYGPADFDEPEWPQDAREQLNARNRRISDALEGLAKRLGTEVERLYLTTVDLPYATVRRHALAGKPIPPYTEDLVAQIAAEYVAH